jgi:hypothetical protein
MSRNSSTNARLKGIFLRGKKFWCRCSYEEKPDDGTFLSSEPPHAACGFNRKAVETAHATLGSEGRRAPLNSRKAFGLATA